MKQIYHYVYFLSKKYIFSKWYIRQVSNISFKNIPTEVRISKKPYIKNEHNLASLSFIFLNQKVSFENSIKWNEPGLSKLLLYNLHYFDYILHEIEDFTPDTFVENKKIILSWIINNPVGFKNGWEPYPLSLRIVNWIFYYYKNDTMFDRDQKFKQVYLRSLYQQCAYLSHFIEYHILANHLLKNSKAMLFGGYFFEKNEWIQKGEKILGQELREQILPDGGHFERSPMYHSITVEDILDIINLKCGLSRSQVNLEYNRMIDIAKNMLKWLHTVIQPDMEIPLIGDSALQAALNLEQLQEYYYRVCKDKLELENKSPIESLEASGYYVFRSSDQYLIADGGKLGVDYQPGHAHCDLLSYEYSYKDVRFIVDTGVGEYLNSELRQKARSIYGHNCVVVNEMDQAEIWQTFRMGSRIKPPLVEILFKENMCKFSGFYENRLSKKYAYSNRRVIVFIENKFFHIKDQIRGKKIFNIKSLLHFHPDCKIKIQGKKIKITHQKNSIYILIPDKTYSVEIKSWFYVPEFGKKLPSVNVVIKPDLSENDIIQYFIVPGEFLRSAEQYLNDHMVG